VAINSFLSQLYRTAVKQSRAIAQGSAKVLEGPI
jgi:hypothetical protein